MINKNALEHAIQNRVNLRWVLLRLLDLVLLLDIMNLNLINRKSLAATLQALQAGYERTCKASKLSQAQATLSLFVLLSEIHGFASSTNFLLDLFVDPPEP